MLKFIFIGIGVILVAAAIAIIMWLIIKNRRLNLWSAEHDLRALGDFLESKAKADEAKKAQTRLLWFAILTTAILVLITTAYFIGARFYFHEHHEHKYIESVKIESTCIKEGTRGYKCKYCDEYYEEPIAVIDHKYEETDRQEPTCVQDGFITYTCNMCNDSYNEPIAKVEHEYEESGRQEPTCVQEGFITYTCKICKGSYNEPIKMVEHIYSEKERKEADCTNTGFIKYACTGCGVENVEEIPVNSNHQYKIVSFSETSFWKNGYNHLSCELCGEQCYSLKVNSFNWICILAIIIIVVAVIIIISVASTKRSYESVIEKPWFWIATVFATLSIAFLLLHFVCVVPNQQEGGHWYDNYSNAPQNCELTEVGRSESTYTQNGTITYKDNANGTEYVEYLPKKEIVTKDIPQYSEKQYSDVSETSSNGSIKSATPVPLFSKVTGRLSDKDDKADYYSFTVAVPSKMHFVFTHDADNIYSYYWYATIYATDGKTVLNEGTIPNQDKYEFGASDLQPGTYYLRITAPTGGNPLMNGFTDANYYISFTPECIEHASQTQYFTKTVSCLEAGEIVTVCDSCGTIVNTEQIDSLGHKWSEWNIEKEASILQLGQKSRTCSECGEAQTKVILTYVWLAAFIIVCLAVLSLFLLFGEKYEGYKKVISAIFIYCLVVFPLIYFAFSKYPLCGSIVAGACILISIIPMIAAKKDREPGWVTFAIIIMVISLIVGSLFSFKYYDNKSECIEIESTIHSVPDKTSEEVTTDTTGENDNSPVQTSMNTSAKHNEAKPSSQGGKPSGGEEVPKSSQWGQSTTQSSKEKKSSTVTPGIQEQTDPTKKSEATSGNSNGETTSTSEDTSQTQPGGIYIGGLDDPIIPDIIIPGADGHTNFIPVEEQSESLPEIRIQEQEDPTEGIVIVSPEEGR